MSKITIPKIRPASWKVYVQGEREARYVSRVLGEAEIDTAEFSLEPGLSDPPLHAIVGTPKAEVPLTEEELVAILEQHEKLELMFDFS
jgi:hypothetical protein